jgi:hypothetical protein
MSVTHLAERRVSGGSDTQAVSAAEVRPGAATGGARPRVTPPFAFEAEEFNPQFPDEDWRLHHGLPQTLDFPSTRN